ncbi:MAG: hypothetical protein FJ395_17090 [Verrucomicrobia bacterium]|nr:hypothetical protein [Verrucomicrobiota bacterium]
MNTVLPACRACNTQFPPSHYNAPDLLPCPQCGTPSRVAVFRALAHPPVAAPVSSATLGDGDAGCFYHPAKPAATVCDGCGRFLCALCDLELGEQHYCPSCLEAGRRKRSLTRLEPRRVLYDNIALGLAVVPVLTCFLFPLTSPVAVAVAIWGWRKPSSLLPRTKARFILAILIASAGLGLGIAYWIAIFNE